MARPTASPDLIIWLWRGRNGTGPLGRALLVVGLGYVFYMAFTAINLTWYTYRIGEREVTKVIHEAMQELALLLERGEELEPGTVDAVRGALRRRRRLLLARDLQVTILLSSHLLGDVESVCDEVLILKEGRVAATCDLAAQRRANRRFVELELLEELKRYLTRVPDSPPVDRTVAFL